MSLRRTVFILAILASFGPAAILRAQSPQGDAAYQAKDWAGAALLYEKAAPKSKDARMFERLGNCYYYLGKKLEALDAYERALDLNLNDSRLAAFANRLRAELSNAPPVKPSAKKPKKNWRSKFNLRLSPGAIQPDVPAYNGDSAAYDEVALLYNGWVEHLSGPPIAGGRVSIEPTFRISRRLELGLEAGAMSLEDYSVDYADLRAPANGSGAFVQTLQTTASQLGLNLRWHFHLGPGRTDFHLLAGAATYPVKIAYYRSGQDLPSLLDPAHNTPYELEQDGTLSARHSGVHFGMGSDFSIGKRWFLSPELRWRWARVSNFRGVVQYQAGGWANSVGADSRLWQEKEVGLLVALPTVVDPGAKFAPMGLSLNGLEISVGLGIGF